MTVLPAVNQTHDYMSTQVKHYYFWTASQSTPALLTAHRKEQSSHLLFASFIHLFYSPSGPFTSKVNFQLYVSETSCVWVSGCSQRSIAVPLWTYPSLSIIHCRFIMFTGKRPLIPVTCILWGRRPVSFHSGGKDCSNLACVSEFEKRVSKKMSWMSQSGPSFASIQKSAMKCDPACENPAKVFFFQFTVFCIKSLNIMERTLCDNNLDICTIEWQKLKS